MLLRYKFRAYPSPGQQIALARAFGCARVVFNDAVAERKAAFRSGLPYPRVGELSKRLITQAKSTSERAFLAAVSSVVLQQALADCDQAYRNFFDSMSGVRKGPKVGPPCFRKRTAKQSIRFTKNASFRILENGKLRLPKIGDVNVRWSRELPSAPTSVSVMKARDGQFHVSFVVDVDPEPLPELPDDCDTGLDLGLSTFAVLRGRVIETPKFLRMAENKVRKAQRQLCRKQKGSRNRAKARITLAKVHDRVANRRHDFIEKESSRIVRENQAVYVEDLNLKGMANKRGRRGKSVHDQALGRFVRVLEAKCARYGRSFVRVDRWFPSTQLCSSCGSIGGPKGLEGLLVRTWHCRCGTVHDRDMNAERNIRVEGRRVLAEGRSERLNACGAQVRPVDISAQCSEAGTRRGIKHKARTRLDGAVGISAS